MVGVTLIEEKFEPLLHKKLSMFAAVKLTLLPRQIVVGLLTVTVGSNTVTATVAVLLHPEVLVPVVV